MKYLISLAVLFCGATAFAEVDAQTKVSEAKNTCFNQRTIRNWRAIDRDTLDVWGSRNRRWRIDTFSCWELKWSNRIAFRSFGGSSRICRGDDVLVLDDFSNKIVDRCRIRRITRIQ